MYSIAFWYHIVYLRAFWYYIMYLRAFWYYIVYLLYLLKKKSRRDSHFCCRFFLFRCFFWLCFFLVSKIRAIFHHFDKFINKTLSKFQNRFRFFFSDVFSGLFFLGFLKMASAFLFTACIFFLVETVVYLMAFWYYTVYLTTFWHYIVYLMAFW